MALGLVLGLSLVMAGLLLMCHLSYTNLGKKGEQDCEDLSMAGNTLSRNDCFLPCCYFRAGHVHNHETWIVTCLLSGALVLWVSMV